MTKNIMDSYIDPADAKRIKKEMTGRDDEHVVDTENDDGLFMSELFSGRLKDDRFDTLLALKNKPRSVQRKELRRLKKLHKKMMRTRNNVRPA